MDIRLVKVDEVPMGMQALSTLLVTLPRPRVLTPETLVLLALGLAIYRLVVPVLVVSMLLVTIGTPLFLAEFMLMANLLPRHRCSEEKAWWAMPEARLLLATRHSMTVLLGRVLWTDPVASSNRLTGVLRSDLVEMEAVLIVRALV